MLFLIIIGMRREKKRRAVSQKSVLFSSSNISESLTALIVLDYYLLMNWSYWKTNYDVWVGGKRMKKIYILLRDRYFWLVCLFPKIFQS